MSGLNDGIDSGFMKVPSPAPFRGGNSRSSVNRNGSIEDGGSGSRLNNEYYASGIRERGNGLNDRASSSESGKYES